MAGEPQQFAEGADPTQVWRDVAVLFKRIQALENMELNIKAGGVNLTGKLEVGEGRCVLTGK